MWSCGVVEVQSLDGLPPFLGVSGVGGTTTILGGCLTAAPPRSVNLCLAVGGIASVGPGASADRKLAVVAEGCCWRELSIRWPRAPREEGIATSLAR